MANEKVKFEADELPWWVNVLWFCGIITIALVLGMISEALGCGTGHSDAAIISPDSPPATTSRP